MRDAVLLTVLAFIALLTFLTISVLAREGFDILVGLSLSILGLLAVGVVGALLHPPEK